MTPGEKLFTALKQYRLVNELRGWEPRSGVQDYEGRTWKTHSPGLRTEEKQRYEEAARMLGIEA